jgi:glycosyltransferase involved in cell wall biosynthesis
MQISVVIPTCNRKESLFSVLECLNRSSHPIDEVILVDSSDRNIDPKNFEVFENLKIIYLEADRSVCVQRNIGIKKARNEWILLCDDDIDLPMEYVGKLVDYLKHNPATGAVTGRWFQNRDGVASDQYPVRNFFSLVWHYFFQLSVWGNIDHFRSPAWLRPLWARVLSFYKETGNSHSRAGWPLITNWTETFTTSFYSFGAAMIKREWLLQSPYDEVLDPSGIGDHYGVALSLSGKIQVISSATVFHRLEKSNRLHKAVSYYRRVLALHYFIRKSNKFSKGTVRWLLWSLIGNSVKFTLTFQWLQAWASFKSIVLIVLNRNPYWIGFKKNQKIIKPLLTF